MIDSASDDRVKNNVMRHEYRQLSDAEKVEMKAIKDAGVALCDLILNLQTRRMAEVDKSLQAQAKLAGNNPAAYDMILRTQVKQAQIMRACDVAQQRAEESIMWVIKALTN
jgi:hypothetical protein